MADNERKYVANIEIRADNAVEAGQRLADSMNRVVEQAQSSAQAIYSNSRDRLVKRFGEEAVQYKEALDREMKYQKSMQKIEQESVAKQLKEYEAAERKKEQVAQKTIERERKNQEKLRAEEQKRYSDLSKNSYAAWWKQQLSERERVQQEELEYERAVAREELEILKQREAERQRISENMVNVTRRALQVTLRKIKQVFTDAVQYVKEYDKALTSIAIVTGDATQKSALGQRYENIARDMKVTSVEIATAAEELYRQGITDTDQVEERLKTITQFAKISGLTFEESVETMTAAINNYTREGENAAEVARRIADVWSYLGDATATGADEIGIAMQKVAASGSVAGVTLEKLSSYIAVIEAKTRLAPESVGTTLNSIMSRYMKVTSVGFNKSVTTDEGDVLNLNDISKALQTVGINIYNAETGFQSFGDILDQLSGKWGALDDKQRAYIATQMAGTRGLNMFLALMDGYQESLELTAGAYDSAGTAAQKYGIWQDGLEATANELSAIIKDIYSDVLNSDAVKGFYEVLISLAKGFDAVVKATDGWNVKIALLGAGLFALIRVVNTVKTSITQLGGLSAVFRTLTGALTGSTVAAKGLSLALGTVGIGVAVGLVTTLIGSLFTLRETEEEVAQRWKDINDKYDESDANIRSYDETIKTLTNSMNTNTMSVDEYYRARNSLVSQYPALESVLTKEIKQTDDLAEAYRNLTVEAERATSTQLRASYVLASDNYAEADSVRRATVDKLYGAGKYGYNDSTIGADILNVSASTDKLGAVREIFKNGTMADVDEYIKLINERLEYLVSVRDQIDQSGSSVYFDSTDEVDNAIEETQDLLSFVEQYAEEEAVALQEKLAESTQTILRAALNPDVYSDVARYIPNIVNAVAQDAFYANMDSDQLVSYVKQYLKLLSDAFTGDGYYKTELDRLFPDGNVAEMLLQKITTLDRQTADEYAEELSKSIQEALTNGNIDAVVDTLKNRYDIMLDEAGKAYFSTASTDIAGGMTGGTYNGGETNAESEFSEAYKKLQQIQTLYDAIREMQTTGELEAKSKKSLADAYPELESSMGDYNELLEQTISLFAEENNVFGPLLDKYGLSAVLNKELSSSLVSVVAASDKTANILKKLHKGYDLTEDDLKEIVKTYPELLDDLYQYTAGTKDSVDMLNALSKAQSDANGAELMKGVKEQIDVLDKYGQSTAEYASAMEQIGNLFTMGFGDLTGSNFAAQYLDDIRAAANGSEDALRRLQEAAFIHITGSADVDFSAAKNGLIDVSKMSAETLAILNRLGLFDIQTIQLPQTYYTFEASEDAGLKTLNAKAMGQAAKITPVKHTVYTTQTVLKPKNASSFKIPSVSSSSGSGSSGGGGGGGGGGGSSSSSAASSAVQNKLAELKKMTEIIDLRIKIAQAWQGFYEQTGELNKTIPYMEHQIDLYNELIGVYQQNRNEIEPMVSTYADNVKAIKDQIASLEALRDKYVEGSSNYKKYQSDIDAQKEKLEEAESDYNALIEAVDEYTLSEIEAKRSVVELTDAIDEQRYKIRDLTADMKNQISDYLDDIKAREKDILNATVSMQNEIMDILRDNERKRLELDNEVLENKKKTLTDELDAIRKNYDEARALADKQAQEDTLAEKQRQLATLALDPTKAKERAALEKEIYDLQKQMSWDAAEDQISAQEASVQAQIDEYDKLIEANEKAIDQLSEYSEDIINQMYEIMSRGSEYIMKWLKDNSDEYAESTKEAQQVMVDDWQDTLDTIDDLIRTNWDEVDRLINEGVDAVVDKLKETSDYLSANTEDQINQIEDLRKAWEKMIDARAELTDAEFKNNKLSILEGSTGSAGGSGSAEAQVNPPSVVDTEPTGVTSTVLAAYNMRESPDVNSKRITTLQAGTSAQITGYKGEWYKVSAGGKEGWMSKYAFDTIDLSKLKKYKNGGIIDSTGLLWADGTPGVPEGILSGEQFKLFRSFVSSLEQLSAPDYSGRDRGVSGFNVEEGGIVINVGSLDSSSDYNDVADQILDALYDKFMVRR